MDKRHFVLLLILCGASCVWSQNITHEIKPKWLTSELPTPDNNSYIYIIETAEGNTIQEARNNCEKALANDQALLNSVSVSSEIVSHDDFTQKYDNSSYSESLNSHMTVDIRVKGLPFNLQAKIIDEHHTQIKNSGHNRYVTTILYQTAVTQHPTFTHVEVTSKYGARGLWRSAIVPGWGQFHKHSYLKGGLILGGTAVLAGGIIFTEVTRADYAKKITMTHDKKAMATYANRRNNFALARNICIGATAALYIYNLVDAIVAPGARYVKVQKVDRNGRSYAFAPTVTYEGAPAATMAITF